MKFYKKYIVLGFALLSFCVQGQDIYLSHFDAAPQYLNPALTGMYFGEELDYRLNVNYAAQSFGSFSNVFNTASMGYDVQINKFGIGGYLVSSQAGVTNYNVLNGFLSIAYEISIDPTYRHNLLTGIQLGVFHNSFNQDKLTFQNQYNTSTGGFDQTMSSGEDFEKTSVFTFDAGWGAFYEYRDRRKMMNPFIGFSIFHPTSPNVSFYGEESKYPVKFSIYSGTAINFNEVLRISPKALFMRQANRQMLDVGLFGYYNPRFSHYGYMLGLLYNTTDNFTVHTGIKINSNTYRISYGFNTSFQDNINSGRDNIEISVILSRKTNSKPSFDY